MFNILKYTLLEMFRSRMYLVSMWLVMLIAVLSHCGAQINDNYGDATLATLTFGMYFTRLVGFVFLILTPVFGLSAEFESGAIQFVLARCIRRPEYLLGKYAASLILYAGLLVLSAVSLAVTIVLFAKVSPALAYRLWLFVFTEWLSGAMLLSIVFALYAAIKAPIATAMLSAVAFFLSQMLDTVKGVADTSTNTVGKVFYLLLYYGYPGFRFFDLEKPIAYNLPVAASYLAVLVVYAVVVVTIMLALACSLFRRREI